MIQLNATTETPLNSGYGFRVFWSPRLDEGMMTKKKPIRLAFMLEGYGRSNADWRHPKMPRNAGTNFEFHKSQTLLAEKGKLDFVFVADTLWMDADAPTHRISRIEPVVLLSALAAATTRIGLVGTVSTTYTEPFNLARQIASLDHVSNGRAGWNLVTSDPAGAASLFGRSEQPTHDERYEAAYEYLDVVRSLWDTFEDGALVQNRATGTFLDKSRLHTTKHDGTYYHVNGRLNMDRPPQGHPVVVTPTLSSQGRKFAGESVDAVFYNPEGLLEAQAFYRDVKSHAAAVGRDPDKIVLMPSTKPVVGSTEEEAHRKYQERAENIKLEDALGMLGKYFLSHDFTQYNPDQLFPQHVLDLGLNGFQGSVLRIRKAIDEERLTLRQVAMRFAMPRSTFVGTPEQLADRLEEWVDGRGVDGYILGETQPGEFGLFVEEVIPILQQRERFRREYEGTTLRDHLGLDRPMNCHIANPAVLKAS